MHNASCRPIAIAIVRNLRHLNADDCPAPRSGVHTGARVLCCEPMTAKQVLDAVGSERESIMVVGY
jgi:hypothetical protein